MINLDDKILFRIIETKNLGLEDTAIAEDIGLDEQTINTFYKTVKKAVEFAIENGVKELSELSEAIKFPEMLCKVISDHFDYSDIIEDYVYKDENEIIKHAQELIEMGIRSMNKMSEIMGIERQIIYLLPIELPKDIKPVRQKYNFDVAKSYVLRAIGLGADTRPKICKVTGLLYNELRSCLEEGDISISELRKGKKRKVKGYSTHDWRFAHILNAKRDGARYYRDYMEKTGFSRNVIHHHSRKGGLIIPKVQIKESKPYSTHVWRLAHIINAKLDDAKNIHEIMEKTGFSRDMIYNHSKKGGINIRQSYELKNFT